MGNVWRVLKRDLIRLFKSPATLVVALVLVVLPSTYTWFNVYGFWDPYNNTGSLRVCVVDEDEGADSDLTGHLDLGGQIVEQLGDNTQLGWEFTDYDTAIDLVSSGEAYAAYVIPADFSKDFASLATSDYTQPRIEYYVNEKENPVSPKITDTGATTLEQTVNSTFVSTVSGVAGDAVDRWIAASQGKIDSANNSVLARMVEATDAVDAARTSVQDLDGQVDTVQAKAGDAADLVAGARDDLSTVSDALLDASALAVATQNSTGTFAASISSALDDGSAYASRAALRTSSDLGAVSSSASAANARMNAALAGAQTVSSQLGHAIDSLTQLKDRLPADSAAAAQAADALDRLNEQKSQYDQTISDIGAISSSTAATADALSNVADTANDAVQSSLSAGATYRDQLSSTTLPALMANLYQIGSTTSGLAASVSNQQLVISQALVSLGQLSSSLDALSDALDQTGGLLDGISTELTTAKDDISALAAASVMGQLPDGGKIDAQKVANFMASPTTVQTVAMYPLNAYGSAMAPLFMNLTLWIGVFMLLVILRQEVDDEGIENLTLTQRYMARWLFFAILCTFQAIVCCAGCLFLGVQCENVPLYFLSSIAISLTYLSVQYALALTFLHVGKGLCIIMVFAQIPGATGLYPIEMTPRFFQAIYPFMPFTYGINALRETIGGLYGNALFAMLGVLVLFAASGFLLGLVIRPYFTNLNRMSAHQIEESDILNGEEVQAPPRRFRVAQLVNALSHRADFRTRLNRHRASYLKHYPRLIRGAVVFGIVMPTVLTATFTIRESAKVVTLTMWLILLIMVLLFLIVVEHIRDYFEHEIMLEDLSDDELRELFVARNGMRQAADGALLDGGLLPYERRRERVRAAAEAAARKADAPQMPNDAPAASADQISPHGEDASPAPSDDSVNGGAR